MYSSFYSRNFYRAFHAENLGTRDVAKSKAGNAPALVELTFFLQSQITASQQISK